MLERWFTPGFREAQPELMAQMRRGLTDTSSEGYAGCCEAIAAMDLHPMLGSITAPTLVIAGAEDPATPPEHGRRSRMAIPGARFELIEGAAHLANIEKAELVTPLIRDSSTQNRRDRERQRGVRDRDEDPARGAGRRARRSRDRHGGQFGAPWQEFITRYAWGGVWSRPGIDRRMRSAITLAALISMRAENEIGMHVRAALRNGLTVDEISEVFIHTAVYAGVPASNAAFAVAAGALGGRRDRGRIEPLGNRLRRPILAHTYR